MIRTPDRDHREPIDRQRSGAPTEVHCRRGSHDTPVTIRTLKRFVNERYGTESVDFSHYRAGWKTKMLPSDKGEGTTITVVGACAPD